MIHPSDEAKDTDRNRSGSLEDSAPSGTAATTATVVLAQPRITHYRTALFESLRSQLRSQGIRLRVVHGSARGAERLERDRSQVPWAEPLPELLVPGTGGRALWLPIAASARDADLVIVPEFAGWLATYDLLLRRVRRRQRVACWGHGPSPDDHARSPLTRAVRRALAPCFDWWFSYTDGTTQRLASAGVPSSRITTLYNTTDVEGLRAQIEALRPERNALREAMDLRGPSALFLGALRPNKRIDLLLDTAERVAKEVDGFTLIVGGDGPDRPLVERRLRQAPWLRCAGAVLGVDKARLLLAADLMLQPAWLGLVVVEAFAAGLPIVTFDRAGHGPEEEYLRDDVEGVRVAGLDPADLARAAIALVRDEPRRKRLAEAAFATGSRHSIQTMAQRFAKGIRDALRRGDHS